MAQSTGTYSTTLNTYKIVAGALRLLGAIQTGETVQPDEYSDCLEALNALTKHLQATGIHVWSEIDCHLFLQPNQQRYVIGSSLTESAAGTFGDHSTPTIGYAQTVLSATAAQGASSIVVADTFNFASAIGTDGWVGVWLDSGTTFWAHPVSITGNIVFLSKQLTGQATSGAQVSNYQTDLVRPLKVPSARRYQYAPAGSVAIETPLAVYSRIDYGMLTNKGTPGTVTSFFYDPSMSTGNQDAYSNTPGISQVLVWPAPSNNQDAVRFTAQRPLQDFTTQANTADLPQEWLLTLRYQLAVTLAAEYDCAPARFQMIKGLADEYLEVVKMWDREVEPVMFGLSQFPASRT